MFFNLRKYLFCLLASFIGLSAFAQKEQPKWYGVSGYIKDLQIFQWADYEGSLLTQQFVHNRLNFAVYPTKDLELHLQLRTRFFTGEAVKIDADFAKGLDMDRGFFDASFNLLEEKSAVLNTTLDRFYVQYNAEKFDLSIGRQRINWGMNLVWNPNDLFNAYNFFDFDYEERPGADAVRLQIYPGALSRVDLAVAPGRSDSEWVAAGLYGFNLFGYDFQLLGGRFLKDWSAGMGWAGNIAELGFKGEVNYFKPLKAFNGKENISSSISLDYSFGNGYFVSAGGLFNQIGAVTRGDPEALSAFSDINAKTLMPTRYSILLQGSGAIGDRTSYSLGGLYSPKVELIFIGPSIEYSIAQNWDLGAFGQLFWLHLNGKVRNAGNAVFIRIRYDFGI